MARNTVADTFKAGLGRMRFLNDPAQKIFAAADRILKAGVTAATEGTQS